VTMTCRAECGACCIAPSIQQALPGMPMGKPAGVTCVNLDEVFACRLFGRPERPALCAQFKPELLICGDNRAHAMQLIQTLEIATGA
jgi:hypothetical protein